MPLLSRPAFPDSAGRVHHAIGSYVGLLRLVSVYACTCHREVGVSLLK